RGVFEHADHATPRLEHGYCVDDVARALMVVVREPNQTPQLATRAEAYLSFVATAVTADGRCRNRLSVAGDWADDASVGDCWGRALWGLGTAYAESPALRRDALEAAHTLAAQRSPDVRAMAFAAIGAGEFVLAGVRDDRILALLADAAASIPVLPGREWAWPEDRLRYANGSLAEAAIIAGQALEDPMLLFRGLDMLETLLHIETRGGHLSVTGTEGRGPEDRGVLFDQQPIEVAAIADAAARAFAITGERRWRHAVELAWRWFLGDNDSGIPMVDLATGAGFDGLERHGRNENRGAESTLAALSTWQHARRLDVLDYES
ncbi:MAG: glycosyltransferase, partial [Pseudolysinimonas sp.]